VYTQDSLKLSFELLLDGSINTLGDWYLALYDNNYTPDVTSAPGNFAETTLGGYAQIAQPIGNWTISTTATGAKAVMLTAVFTFTPGGTGDSLYGYYLVDGGDLTILGAERFTGAPINITVAGGTLTVDVELDFNSP
jgi:hypothetical protein